MASRFLLYKKYLTLNEKLRVNHYIQSVFAHTTV